MPHSSITTLFLDIGGVLLTNGWGRDSRRQVAADLNLDFAEMDERHHLTFDTYESGKLSLDDYLQRVVFYEKRPFTPDAFKQTMFNQTRPFPDMITLMSTLKTPYPPKTSSTVSCMKNLQSLNPATNGFDAFN
jgi:putative hydrolase of the HAD superfamily